MVSSLPFRLHILASKGSFCSFFQNDIFFKFCQFPEIFVLTGKIPEKNLSLYPDISTLSDSLENGSIDASVIQTPSQERIVAGRALVVIGSIPVEDTYAVATRQSDPELLAKVNRGLSDLMKDPAWQVLKQKYGLTD